MDPSNNSLQWMTFSVLADDYPSFSSAFAHNKGLFKKLTDTVELPDRPAQLKEDANDAQTRVHEVQTQARATKLPREDDNRTQIRSGATW